MIGRIVLLSAIQARLLRGFFVLVLVLVLDFTIRGRGRGRGREARAVGQWRG
jgi:hypothetical protein